MKSPAPHGVCWVTDFFITECRERGCISRCATSTETCTGRPTPWAGPAQALFPACPAHRWRDQFEPADFAPEVR